MPTDPRRPTSWWIAPVLGLVAVTVAVSALITHNLYHQPTATPAPVVAPTGTSVPGRGEPGLSTVMFAPDVATYPQHTQLLSVLQTYFNAINDKKYDEFVSVVTPALAAEQTKALFAQGYQSTRDGSIFVYRVDTAPHNGLRVLTSFTSTQALNDAPINFQHTCIRWQVVLPLAWDPEVKQWEIDAGITGSSPQTQVC
ncbi:MAG TPA: hypothetical protein VH352_01035 [Pseudonocardiaceae bacterium]|nr:hypothetical protein [Pseudonocardiaceae bacterium]